MFEHLHNSYSQVVQNLQESRERNKAIVAKQAIPSNFKPGDLVFYFDASIPLGNTSKFTLPWKTHYIIVSKFGEENYCINNMITIKTKNCSLKKPPS